MTQVAWSNLVVTPRGTIKPQPFAVAVIAIYATNLVLMTMFEAETVLRASVWPLLGIQLALTWAWYVVHAKRLRDAGKGATVAAVIAVVYALCVIVFAWILVVAATQTSVGNAEPKSSIGMIFVILLVAYAFNTGQFGIVGLLLVAYLLLPFVLSLFVVIYSTVTGMRESLTPDPAPEDRASAR